AGTACARATAVASACTCRRCSKSSAWPSSSTIRATTACGPSNVGRLKRSTERILTTHVGSLARPHALLRQLQSRINGEPYDADDLARLTRDAVAEVVHKQAKTGI